MPIWLTDAEHRTLAAALDRLIPANGPSPGAGESGGADYVDHTLGAFTFDPPHIWAGGPFSGRHGGDASFGNWLELAPVEELAWRMRIEGSRGIAEREFNGRVVGWQEVYRAGLGALGADFADLDAPAQDERIAGLDDEVREVMFTHACESLYGDPTYGGNRDAAAWHAIAFDGDVQPRGWTDAEVATP
jgi:hypothetical protein